MANRIISHYELETLLGEGAMGRVYRARDTILERLVALKLVGATSPADPAFMDRFLREARLAAQLNHPNVATIYEFGVDQGEAFLVMELVDGRTLAEVLLTGGRSVAEVRRWGAQAAAALAAAHAQGIVHRDIKPGNLMLTRSGLIKVMDFGIARRAGDVHLTTEGQLVGTPKTMAPEILRGLEPGPPADLFSLGCVLYEALAGRPPFTAQDAMAVLYQIAQQDAPSLAGLRPDAPADLVQVIDGLLVKDPAQRFGPAAAVAATLSGEEWVGPEDARVLDETIALSSSEVARSTGVPVARTGVGATAARSGTGLGVPMPADAGPVAATPGRARRASPVVLVALAAAFVLGGAGIWYALHGREGHAARRARAMTLTARGVDLVRWIESQGFAVAPPESIEAARQHFTAAARVDPSFAVPWNNLGDLSFQQKHYVDAEREFRAALQDSATYAPAHANLGQLYEDQGRFADAEAEYRLAMAQDSTLVAAPNNLAHMLARQGRGEEAAAVLLPALRRWPQVAPLWKNYGNALIAMGDVEAADSALSQSLLLQPEQPEVRAARMRVTKERLQLAREIEALKTRMRGSDRQDASEALRELQALQALSGDSTAGHPPHAPLPPVPPDGAASIPGKPPARR